MGGAGVVAAAVEFGPAEESQASFARIASPYGPATQVHSNICSSKRVFSELVQARSFPPADTVLSLVALVGKQVRALVGKLTVENTVEEGIRLAGPDTLLTGGNLLVEHSYLAGHSSPAGAGCHRWEPSRTLLLPDWNLFACRGICCSWQVQNLSFRWTIQWKSGSPLQEPVRSSSGSAVL